MPQTSSKRRIKTIIHVNQHVIKKNRATGSQDPPLTIKTYKETTLARDCIIHGPSTVIYRPEAPLACGAHVWIETYADVETRKGD